MTSAEETNIFALRVQSPKYGYIFAFRRPARVWLEHTGEFWDIGVRLFSVEAGYFDVFLPSPWRDTQRPSVDVILDELANQLFLKCDELLASEADGVMSKEDDDLLTWIRGAFTFLDGADPINPEQSEWAASARAARRERLQAKPPTLWDGPPGLA